MKKNFKMIALTFVLFVGALVLVGCGKDKGIVGKWDHSGFVYTFNEDGTGNYDALGTKMEFTYTIKDNKLSILYTGNTEPFETEFKIENNVLTIKDSFDEDVKYERK